jgi:hypothetical protein
MKKLPASLLVGLVLYVLHDLGMMVRSASLHWRLAAGALDLVSWALIAVGLGELARRSRNRALRVGFALFVIVAVWTCAKPILEVVSNETRWTWPWHRYTHAVVGALLTAAVAALVVAAEGLRRAPLASVLPLVAMVTQGWIPGTDHVLLTYLQHHEAIANLYWLVNGLMLCGGMFVLAQHMAVEPESDVKVAVGGLRIIESALKFRVVFAVATLAVGLGMIPAWNTSKVFTAGTPLLAFATLAIAAFGCLRFASANLERQSCMQTVIGSALILWWCELSLMRSVYVIGSYASVHAIVETWSLLGPLAMTAGFVIIGMEVLKRLPSLREVLAARMVVFIVLSIVAILIQTGVVEATLRTHIELGSVAAFANIGAALAFASLAGRAADAIGKSGVPEARVVSTSQP